MALQPLARALRHRNYRLFFAGQSISLVGTWLTRVATSWLVYRLTSSAFLLGVVGFAGQIPTLLFAPFAGVWLDRVNRHRVLVVTQVAAMIQSALLAFYALRGTITVVHILVLNAFQGLINAFDMPARQAFVVEMVKERDDLPNAIALNSSMVNTARLLGPTIAGLLIAAVGEGWCFAIDAASYLAVIASLLAMHIERSPRARRQGRVLAELGEGARYALGFAPIRAILVLLAVISLMGMPYMVLMPVVVTDVLFGGPNTLGFLMAASGLGALLGTLYLASRTTVLGLGRIIAGSAAAFGISLVLFSYSRAVWLSILILPFCGMSMIVQMAASNTVLQTIVDDDKRARIMSFYTMALVGTAPFGSLFAGALAARLGAPLTLRIGGAVCLLAALLFMRGLPRLRKLVRPTYERLGLLRPVADGLQSAANLTSPPQS